LQLGGDIMKEATFQDAVALAQKLNLDKDSVWKIIEGRKYSTLTELAMAVQAAFAVPQPAHR
jgi:hypothetical protein